MTEERVISILKHLKERAGKPVTAHQLSDELRVSVKTIHNDLVVLKRMLDPKIVELNSQRGVGYYLDIKNITVFHEMLRTLTKEATENNERDFNNPNVRIQYLLEYLLFAKSYILSDILSQEMALSRSQFTNDCLAVREFIKPFNLKLVSKPRLGIRIEGSEFNRRLCIANAYFQKINGSAEDKKSTFLTDVENRELETIYVIVSNVLKSHDYKTSDDTIQNLALHLYIAFKRVASGKKVLIDPKVLVKLKHTDEYQIAVAISKATDQLFQFSLSESEIGYITMHLNGKRVYSFDKTNEFLIDQKIDAIVTRMLDNVEANYGLHLHQDMELRLALGLHLIPLLRRIEFGLILKNPLKEQIKTKITLAYEVAITALEVINDTYDKYLDENEIGYFALHFNLAIDRLNFNNSKKNVLIVCSTGHGSAQLLKANFMRYYAGKVNIVHVIQVNDLSIYDTDLYDLILSTVPLSNHYAKPVILVETFLEEMTLKEIEQNLMSDTQGIEKYFSENIFFPDLEFESKEAVLKHMCEQIAKVKEVQGDMYESVMNREMISTTSFGNLVAIPHPNHPISSETFVAVGILRRQLLWDDKKVQIVFLVSIENSQGRDLQSFYRVVSRLLGSRNQVRELIKNKSYSYLLQVIKECEKGNKVGYSI